MRKQAKKEPASAPRDGLSLRRLENLKAQTVQLSRQPVLNFYRLATSLSVLHDEDGGALHGLPEQTGMSRRRMYYLIDVGNLIREHRLTETRAAGVGWTKLQIVARHVSQAESTSAEELAAYLELAETSQARALAKKLAGATVVRKSGVQFDLSMAARAELNEALLAFGAERTHRGYVKKEAALIKIVRAAIAQIGGFK